LRNSSFNRAALFATAAVQICIAGPAAAAQRSGDAIALLLLGARGPPGSSASTGEVISALLVSGQQPPYEGLRQPYGRARVMLASSPPAASSPIVGRSLAATGRSGDSIGNLLLADSATPAPAPGGARPRRAPVALAPNPNFPAPDPQTLLLLLVQLDDLTLTDGMAAYGASDDPLLPVGELSRLLELDVDVSPTEGRVVGRLGESRRSLIIDLATNTARIGPIEVPLKPGDVAAEPGDIFVRASVLAQLLPLKFDVDGRSLQMRLTATEPLPIQSRMQRLARLRQTAPNPTRQVLRVEEPYRLFSPPSFDVALGLGAQTTTPRLPTRYDIRLGGDLLYAGLQAYVGSDDAGRANTARFLLERRSIDGDLLGPLHARVVGLGDVFTPGLAIGPRSLGGRGVQLSSVPLDQTSVFNRVDLRGPLPLGNDAELYVNDVLQGAQQQGVNGQYEFLNVPLTQGINVVRIVTYGPRGQRNEETRVINASGGLLRPGQITFEFAAVNENEPLFQIRQFDPLTVDPTFGRRRVVAAVNYGLTQSITATVGAALYSDNLGVERQLYTGGLRTSIAGFATQFDLAGDNRGGQGASIDVAGRILGANALVRHSEYRGGLLDENNAEAEITRPLTRRTEFTVDETVRLGSHPVPITVRALRDSYVDGGSAWIGQVRGSASLGSILYSSGLEYDRNTASSGQVSDSLRGALGLSTFRNYEWQVRANVNYNLLPGLRANDVEFIVDRTISNVWSLRFGATERLSAPKGLELLAGSTTRTKYGDLALTGQYDTAGGSWRLGAQMNFGIGYNPRSGYQITRQGPGSGGSVAFHAFIDANGNGLFDPGERAVPNVGLEGGELRATTDAEGRAYLSGFGAGPTARLLVGLAGIENQSVRTPPTVIEFSPRPGGVTSIEYPMRPTGEVMVNIKLRRPDQPPVGLSATRLRLVDDKGMTFDAVTEFDGSANFQDVPVGTYRLELDKEQATRLRMRLTAPATVTIRPDGSSTPDVSAEVIFEPREPADPKPPG
jgi:hypothetical protein